MVYASPPYNLPLLYDLAGLHFSTIILASAKIQNKCTQIKIKEIVFCSHIPTTTKDYIFI